MYWKNMEARRLPLEEGYVKLIFDDDIEVTTNFLRWINPRAKMVFVSRCNQEKSCSIMGTPMRVKNRIANFRDRGLKLRFESEAKMAIPR